ncbi:hypothetical protein [Paracoccus benzoatiresistens]|nr:hypothetical protein [Paracoccus sp. EF6]
MNGIAATATLWREHGPLRTLTRSTPQTRKDQKAGAGALFPPAPMALPFQDAVQNGISDRADQIGDGLQPVSA